MANKIQKLTQSRAEVQRILNESDGLRQQVESELATLKGEGEGSVGAAVEAGVRRVLGGASEAYNTLKEIEDYIKKDEAGAVVLAQNIAKNAKAIDDSPFEKGEVKNSAVLKGTSKATSKFATAFGEQTSASADRAFSEGLKTTASGANSHAEGLSTLAQGQNSHAEGNKSVAMGHHSHAEGNGTIANGGASHAEGSGTITKNNFEHAEGRYNVSNTDRDSDDWGGDNTIHSVGIGTSNDVRKNAHEILQNGKHYIYGIGGYDGTNPSTATDLATLLKSSITDAELDELFND